MLNTDSDALECDFAEYYHIVNLETLGLRKLSILASGLPTDSRIKRKLANQEVSNDTLLRAMMVDALQTLVWTKTKDAQHNRNRPKSITQSLQSVKPKEENYVVYNNSIDFEKARHKILKEVRVNG